jgi:hypothetical protein
MTTHRTDEGTLYSLIVDSYGYAEYVAMMLDTILHKIQSERPIASAYGVMIDDDMEELLEVIDDISEWAKRLRQEIDFLDSYFIYIFSPPSNNLLGRIYSACFESISLLHRIASCKSPPFMSIPIKGLNVGFHLGYPFLLIEGMRLGSLGSELAEQYQNLKSVVSEATVRNSKTRELSDITRSLPVVMAARNSTFRDKGFEQTPKRGRRPKADLKSRSNRELLIAILLEHHRYGSQKERLRTDPISTDEACKQLGKSGATLSKTWKEVQPSLTYAKYVKLCGHYKTLEKLLKAIDSKEGYLERSNREESIDRSEG